MGLLHFELVCIFTQVLETQCNGWVLTYFIIDRPLIYNASTASLGEMKKKISLSRFEVKGGMLLACVPPLS